MALLATVVRASAGLLVVQLLQGPVVEAVREVTQLDDQELAPGKDTPPASLVQGHADRQGMEAVRTLKTNKTFAPHISLCVKPADCWNSKPDESTPACTMDSAQSVCRCADDSCVIDQMQRDPPALGSCMSMTKYYLTQGGSSEVYCQNMIKKDHWKTKHLVKRDADPPADNDLTWSQCWDPNTWMAGKCQRQTRYLGESCWGKWLQGWKGFKAGTCASDPDDGYKTVCYKGICAPMEKAHKSIQCSCATTGYKYGDVCTAYGDQCGGHPCILTEGDDGHCNYEGKPEY